MPQNLLEQLGKQQIPAPPPKLRREVHDRVNTTLVTLQIFDIVLRGLPYAMFHFAQAVAGLILLTFTGTYEPRNKDDARRD